AGSENPSLHAGGGATAACLTEAGHPAASGAAKATARMLMSMVESHREEWGCALTGRQTRRSGHGILYLFGIYSARDPRQAKDFIRNVADEFVTVLTAWGCNFLARSRADRCAERHVASRRSGRRPLSFEESPCFAVSSPLQRSARPSCRPSRSRRSPRRAHSITSSSGWCWATRAPTTSSSTPLGEGSTG